MISGDEISRSADAVKRAATELVQRLGMIDGSYDGKLSEIKTLERQREKLKADNQSIQDKANGVIQQASEHAAEVTKQANKLLEDARAEKFQAKEDREAADRALAEARALNAQALERQRTADNQWRMIEERERKIKAALS